MLIILSFLEEICDDIGIIMQRLSFHRAVDEAVQDDNLPRNESPSVEDEEAVKEAEQPTNPISINKAADNLERLSPEPEGDGTLSELADHNLVPYVPLLLWKVLKSPYLKNFRHVCDSIYTWWKR